MNAVHAAASASADWPLKERRTAAFRCLDCQCCVSRIIGAGKKTRRPLRITKPILNSWRGGQRPCSFDRADTDQLHPPRHSQREQMNSIKTPTQEPTHICTPRGCFSQPQIRKSLMSFDGLVPSVASSHSVDHVRLNCRSLSDSPPSSFTYPSLPSFLSHHHITPPASARSGARSIHPVVAAAVHVQPQTQCLENGSRVYNARKMK